MNDQYDSTIYSQASGWLQDRFAEDYIYSTTFSPVLMLFVAWLQEVVRYLLADPDYREDF